MAITDPTRLLSANSIVERFLSKVRIQNDPQICWEWQASRDDDGYGQFWVKHDKKVSSHRFMYEIAYGGIPEGLQVLHHCDNPPCCNGDHLWAGTNQDNMEDKVRKGRQSRVTGERHGSRTKPERVSRGERHYSFRYPEKVARGEKHGSRTKPGSRARGERVGSAKLLNAEIAEIHRLSQCGLTQRELGIIFDVGQSQIGRVIRGESRKS